MTIPAACPKCGCRTMRVQVLTWAVYRDGKLEGLIIDGDVTPMPLGDGAITCDNDDCDWTSEAP